MHPGKDTGAISFSLIIHNIIVNTETKYTCRDLVSVFIEFTYMNM